MKVNIKGRNVEITVALREYTEKRLAKFEKMLDVDEIYVTMQVIKDSHRVEVTMPVAGIVIRAEEETRTMYESIDRVVDKLDAQIRKYKARYDKKGKAAPKVLPVVQPEEETWAADQIVRIKQFSVKPMTVEEAMMQMEMVDHVFFAFLNQETAKVNVLYKRNDGKYGLLEPEM